MSWARPFYLVIPGENESSSSSGRLKAAISERKKKERGEGIADQTLLTKTVWDNNHCMSEATASQREH